MSPSETMIFENSTIGRSTIPSVPGLIRQGACLVGTVAPRIMSRIALELFLKPQRRRSPVREREWTRNATPVPLPAASSRISAWSVGEGPTILLVHGWSGRGSQLGAFVEPLVRRGYRVAWFDGPGHGASAGKRSSVPELARGLREVGAALGPLHGIIAHSLGTAATTLALRDGLRTERCVYLAPPARMRYFTEVFCKALGLPSTVESELVRRIEDRFGIRFESLEGTGIARTMPLPPSLIIHDHDDQDVPFAHGAELAAAWPLAELIATRGLGHRALLRQPEVIDRVVGFLES